MPNVKVEFVREEPGYQVWFWRSVGHSQNCFFLESFVDEMAAAAGQDPFEFRRGLLADKPRHRRVLELAAEKAGWGKPLPAGVHRGIAVFMGYGSYCAAVAEVSVSDRGRLKVHRLVVGTNCGHIANEDQVIAQVEGSVAYGLSALYYGENTVKNGAIEQTNFHEYRPIRQVDVPEFDIELIESGRHPVGVGEPASTVVAPAVANAIFNAVGVRVRHMPITAEAVLEGLKNKKA